MQLVQLAASVNRQVWQAELHGTQSPDIFPYPSKHSVQIRVSTGHERQWISVQVTQIEDRFNPYPVRQESQDPIDVEQLAQFESVQLTHSPPLIP